MLTVAFYRPDNEAKQQRIGTVSWDGSAVTAKPDNQIMQGIVREVKQSPDPEKAVKELPRVYRSFYFRAVLQREGQQANYAADSEESGGSSGTEGGSGGGAPKIPGGSGSGGSDGAGAPKVPKITTPVAPAKTPPLPPGVPSVAPPVASEPKPVPIKPDHPKGHFKVWHPGNPEVLATLDPATVKRGRVPGISHALASVLPDSLPHQVKPWDTTPYDVDRFGPQERDWAGLRHSLGDELQPMIAHHVDAARSAESHDEESKHLRLASVVAQEAHRPNRHEIEPAELPKGFRRANENPQDGESINLERWRDEGEMEDDLREARKANLPNPYDHNRDKPGLWQAPRPLKDILDEIDRNEEAIKNPASDPRFSMEARLHRREQLMNQLGGEAIDNSQQHTAGVGHLKELGDLFSEHERAQSHAQMPPEQFQRQLNAAKEALEAAKQRFAAVPENSAARGMAYGDVRAATSLVNAIPASREDAAKQEQEAFQKIRTAIQANHRDDVEAINEHLNNQMRGGTMHPQDLEHAMDVAKWHIGPQVEKFRQADAEWQRKKDDLALARRTPRDMDHLHALEEEMRQHEKSHPHGKLFPRHLDEAVRLEDLPPDLQPIWDEPHA